MKDPILQAEEPKLTADILGTLSSRVLSMQVVFAVIAPRQVVPNLVAGAIAEAGANQAGDMMQVRIVSLIDCERNAGNPKEAHQGFEFCRKARRLLVLWASALTAGVRDLLCNQNATYCRTYRRRSC